MNSIVLLSTLCLSLLSCYSVSAVTAEVRNSGNKIAVCSLPECISSFDKVSNLARGITFSACEDPHNPPRDKLASVSVAPKSGLLEQLFDAGNQMDTYWLKQYLGPLLNCQKDFVADCWEAPASGCAKPPPGTASVLARRSNAEDISPTTHHGLRKRVFRA